MRLFLNFKDTSEVGVAVIIWNDKSELLVLLSIREKMLFVNVVKEIEATTVIQLSKPSLFRRMSIYKM